MFIEACTTQIQRMADKRGCCYAHCVPCTALFLCSTIVFLSNLGTFKPAYGKIVSNEV